MGLLLLFFTGAHYHLWKQAENREHRNGPKWVTDTEQFLYNMGIFLLLIFKTVFFLRVKWRAFSQGTVNTLEKKKRKKKKEMQLPSFQLVGLRGMSPHVITVTLLFSDSESDSEISTKAYLHIVKTAPCLFSASYMPSKVPDALDTHLNGTTSALQKRKGKLTGVTLHPYRQTARKHWFT